MCFEVEASLTYKIWKLIDSRFLEDFSHASEHLICDIDKTYLETAFDSLSKLAQIPFEKAREKITVSGAKELLQAYRKTEGELPRPIHFVSASPPQLRRVLSDKFRWDGLSWSSDTFKNQRYNLMQGRFSQVRNQVAYKSAAILNLLIHSQQKSKFHAIGDSAEADPVIYLGIKLFAEGRLSRMGYLQYLRIFGVPRLESLQLLRHSKIPHMSMESILIRRLAQSRYPELAPLTDPLIYFDNFFETALYFFQEKILPLKRLASLTKAFHKYYGISTTDVQTYLELLAASSDSAEFKQLTSTLLEDLNAKDLLLRERRTLNLLKKKNLDAFSALSETEILQLAKEWKKKAKV